MKLPAMFVSFGTRKAIMESRENVYTTKAVIKLPPKGGKKCRREGNPQRKVFKQLHRSFIGKSSSRGHVSVLNHRSLFD